MPTDRSSQPNVLLIVVDSLRADRCSCYGYDRATTPHIDALADEGVVFDNCWSESTWTLPVCFTVLTGLHPREHQSEIHRQLPPEIPTLQDAMKRAGYTTMLASANQFVGRNCGLDRGFDHYFMSPHVTRMAKPLVLYVGRRMGWTDVGGAAVNAHTHRWIEQTDGPWFATVWHNEPHHPYSGKRPYTTIFSPTPLSFLRRQHLMRRMRHMRQLGATADQRELDDIGGLYDGGVAYADHLVGRTVARLKSLGQWDNTVVIVTADHGDMLGEHGLMGHGRAAAMYSPLVRVPLIVRIPGVTDAGTRADAQVQLADIPQTIANIVGTGDTLGATAAPRLDLRDALAGGGRPWVITERAPWDERGLRREQRKNPAFDFAPHAGRLARMTCEGWSLIYSESAPDELYHIAADPDENNDLIGEQPDQVMKLRGILSEWDRTAQPHSATDGLEADDDPEVRKRLEGLGYF